MWRGEGAGAEGRARGQSVRIEVSHIHGVELAPARHVGKHHSRLEHVRERQTVLAQRGEDVVHRLARLAFKAAGRERHGTGNVSELARHIENVADANRLAERKLHGFRGGRIDELHGALLC